MKAHYVTINLIRDLKACRQCEPQALPLLSACSKQMFLLVAQLCVFKV